MTHESDSNDSSDPTNETVLRWAQNAVTGDAEAQREICLWIAPKVYRVIRRIVGTGAAEDVTQEVLFKFFANLDKFRFESRLETWVHQIAVNTSLRHLRTEGRENELKRTYAEQYLTDSSGIECDGISDVVDIAMERLTGEQRAILHMKEVDGLDYRAIAEVLDIPLGTVGSRLNKARTDLRTEFLNLGWRSE